MAKQYRGAAEVLALVRSCCAARLAGAGGRYGHAEDGRFSTLCLV